MATKKRPELVPSVDKTRTRGTRAGDAEAAAAAAALGRPERDAQMKALEQGLRLFREQRFMDAKEWFQRAATGPQLPVMLTAKNHLSVCDRRLQRSAPDLKTAEDHYNYGVERLNARDLERARKHLEIALALRPDCEYMLYALAAAQALSGDSTGAYENLRRAIQVDPRNRVTARQDPDFAGVVHNPLFAQMFQPDKGQPF